MNTTSLLILAFAPGLFWLFYFYTLDKWEPEPKGLILKTYFLGMAMVVPAWIIEVAFQWGFASPLLLGILAAPVVEEFAKYLSVRYTVYPNREFNEPMDGIVYASAAALGFASLENMNYVFGAHADSGELVVPVLIISGLRAFLSVPAHVLFSVMWGYALGAAKFFPDRKCANLFIRRGMFFAIILHALFNLSLVMPWSGLLILAFMAIAWKMVFHRIKTALRNSPFAEFRE